MRGSVSAPPRGRAGAGARGRARLAAVALLWAVAALAGAARAAPCAGPAERGM